MTHPKARTRPRARVARTDPKRYRRTPAGRAWLEQRAPAGAPVATCVYCGCTDERACPGGCSWLIVDYDTGRGICTNCRARPLAEASRNQQLATKHGRALPYVRALENALITVGVYSPAKASKP